MSSNRAGRFRIGPAGWSYPDWAGVVYPERRPRGFRPLSFIASLFRVVEVNASFYAIPTPRMTSGWPAQVPADFRFTFKLTQMFTHERDGFPPTREVSAYKDGIRPIQQAGLLGPLLAQFPWSFRFTRENVAWLERIRDTFAEYERFIEVRHTSWLSEAGLDAIRRVGGFCNIDQPRLHHCIPPTDYCFGKTAYVRLHGRNAVNWFAEGRPPFERYNYLYSYAELREWAARLDGLAREAETVYVIANNHYRGQGVANAAQLRFLLEGKRLALPETLVLAYPQLRSATAPGGGLFDEGAPP